METERRRYRLTIQELDTLWRGWRSGERLSDIARILGKSLSTLHGIIRRHGGIAPAPRRRRATALSLGEREEISRGLATGQSMRALADQLGRDVSTISREIRRNGTRESYRAAEADAAAWRRAARPKPCRLTQRPRLRRVVAAQLRADWSPEQISAWLKLAYPDDPTMQVSHETIYRTLYVQARGALKRDLLAHLRRRRLSRRQQHATGKQRGVGQIVDAISIAERPPTIDDRTVPGHWEGDLLAGGKTSHIATLVERRSRYVHLVKVAGKDTTSVVDALIREVQRLPKGLLASLTWDRGTELAQHARFRVATDVAVYFCDPHSPWQRGSNENTNGLLRQYFPHGMDLRPVTQRQLDAIATKLNTRPRQTLNWRTPAQVLNETVALTG